MHLMLASAPPVLTQRCSISLTLDTFWSAEVFIMVGTDGFFQLNTEHCFGVLRDPNLAPRSWGPNPFSPCPFLRCTKINVCLCVPSTDGRALVPHSNPFSSLRKRITFAHKKSLWSRYLEQVSFFLWLPRQYRAEEGNMETCPARKLSGQYFRPLNPPFH